MKASKVSALLSVEVSSASSTRMRPDEGIVRDEALPLQPGKKNLRVDENEGDDGRLQIRRAATSSLFIV